MTKVKAVNPIAKKGEIPQIETYCMRFEKKVPKTLSELLVALNTSDVKLI